MSSVFSSFPRTAVDVRGAGNISILGAPRGRARGAIPFAHGKGLTGAVLVGLVVAAGLLAPFLTPYSPEQQIAGVNLTGPSASHWLGTDALNRDLLTRTLYGIRVNLLISFIAVPLGASCGCILGFSSAMWKPTDELVQRAFDLILAFPALILGIALSVVFGPGLKTVFILVILINIPIFGRLARTQALRVRELSYVESAAACGAGTWWILRRHIMPNSLSPIMVQFSIAMSLAVFVEGAMSFLGIGVMPPAPSLGSLINEGAAYVYHAPLFAVGPLVVVISFAMGLMLIAQAVSERNRLEP
ncbi:ABC transporter permease [Corynebacterium liangguodongii]|uniref:Peptide ABC transporter permease n=1 Tax=Corynebacterium liangguodongii TaxID=2079535 RepID=A0A2S0WCY2_9CORY|nr:ABC transporter permease [Corynebacterium liangguodongii]AWB83604.1 peptide ABC transporter permease [Corynebacterium liangguodongii]PWB99589.1 ABC transporter permease [Corynebacterium liangguodongii]